jgi:hypothetical protein
LLTFRLTLTALGFGSVRQTLTVAGAMPRTGAWTTSNVTRYCGTAVAVAVGGIAVLVAVGGTGVEVAGTAVLVAVAGTDVAVEVAGTLVAVAVGLAK